MRDEIVSIIENRKVNAKYYKLIFRSPALARSAAPGQFLHIQLGEGLDPFLRRPFSYYRVRQKEVEILYEVLGYGTALLARKRKGDPLQVLGPLGRPFESKIHKKKRVLIGGGVGVPPLVFLAEKFSADYFLVGTKSKKEVLPAKELSRVKAEVLYSTNDGSYGKKGFVTLLLEELIRRSRPSELFIQTCGPNVMMKAVMDIARREGIEGEASVDQPMACGVGVCLGCMVKTPEGWTPSCTKGPVFSFKDILEI